MSVYRRGYQVLVTGFSRQMYILHGVLTPQALHDFYGFMGPRDLESRQFVLD